jgi:hypothetical protein
MEPWVLRYLAERLTSLYIPLWCLASPLDGQVSVTRAVSNATDEGIRETRSQRLSLRSAPLANDLLCESLASLAGVRPVVFFFPDQGAASIEEYSSTHEMVVAIRRERIPHLIRGLFDPVHGIALWRR